MECLLPDLPSQFHDLHRAHLHLQPIPADMRLRISIGMPNFEMPNLDSVLLVQWLTESRFGISLLVQWLTESRFRNSAFEIRSLMYAGIIS